MISLPCFGIQVNLTKDGGTIRSDLHEHNEEPSTDAWLDEQEYNARMDALESMILGHAVAGIDIRSSAYVEGVETAVQACANN